MCDLRFDHKHDFDYHINGRRHSARKRLTSNKYTKMVTLNSLKSSLEAYKPVSIAHSEFKGLLDLFLFADPQPPDSECIKNSREYLPANVLFSVDNIRGPKTLSGSVEII